MYPPKCTKTNATYLSVRAWDYVLQQWRKGMQKPSNPLTTYSYMMLNISWLKIFQIDDLLMDVIGSYVTPILQGGNIWSNHGQPWGSYMLIWGILILTKWPQNSQPIYIYFTLLLPQWCRLLMLTFSRQPETGLPNQTLLKTLPSQTQQMVGNWNALSRNNIS